MQRFVDRVAELSVFGRSYIHKAPRNTALSSPGDFDVPGEGSSGGVSFSRRIISASERSIDLAKFTLFWNCNFNRAGDEEDVDDDDDGSVTFSSERQAVSSEPVQLRQRLAVLWSAEVVRGVIKSVTTSPSAGFCEPLWRFEHQHQLERTLSLRRSPVNSISVRSTERPRARHSFIFSRASLRIRVVRLSPRPALSSEKFNRYTMYYGNVKCIICYTKRKNEHTSNYYSIFFQDI